MKALNAPPRTRRATGRYAAIAAWLATVVACAYVGSALSNHWVQAGLAPEDNGLAEIGGVAGALLGLAVARIVRRIATPAEDREREEPAGENRDRAALRAAIHAIRSRADRAP